MAIKLNFIGGALVLDTSQTGWTTVKLKIGDEQTALGAESRSTIVPRLESMLVRFAERRGGDCEEPEWVLSLSEQHCSVYAQYAEELWLFFQDADGSELCQLALSQDVAERWRRQLSF